MLNRPRYLILILVVSVVVLGLFKLPAQTMTRLKLAIAGLYLPMFGLTRSIQGAAENAGNAVLPRSELVRQITQLRLENQQLQMQKAQTEELWRENSRLRKLVEWHPPAPWKAKLGRVIGREPANWWKYLRIDIGRHHGINPNYPVLTAEGLVGRISVCTDTWAEVVLLGDPNLRIGAVVSETHEQGIVLAGSSSSFLNSLVDLGNCVDLACLPANSVVRPAQKVYTSGDGGLFPRGILIGRIVDRSTVNSGLAVQARVQIAAKLGELEEVWVLLP